MTSIRKDQRVIYALSSKQTVREKGWLWLWVVKDLGPRGSEGKVLKIKRDRSNARGSWDGKEGR